MLIEFTCGTQHAYPWEDFLFYHERPLTFKSMFININELILQLLTQLKHKEPLGTKGSREKSLALSPRFSHFLTKEAPWGCLPAHALLICDKARLESPCSGLTWRISL